ncbi:hypothetical protein AK812_SmicGene47906 [Symbiodinium microadriaticum]|uniref:Uncharacterized protein n=1 Tax=Symbiodinium microadriaticum TaxID=2951 RepID=A0A1Q9BQU4_SYMMI|nr:hypothetical protein AK812_SmicGene47906 [Symbiodinium microadriaticum]
MATRKIHKKCPHGRQRHVCRDCGGSSLCQHDRQKHNCRECGDCLCPHGKSNYGYFCAKCNGKGLCQHGVSKYQCPECRPARLGSRNREGEIKYKCPHGRERHNCSDCNDVVCDVEGCSKEGHRFAGTASLLRHMRAFHGDNPKALTKTKELEVHQLLGKSGIQFEYQHHLPFRGCGLESETTGAFADFVRGAIILEVDESQHSHQDPSCDVRRDFEMAASVALGSQHKLAIVRYNPDAFKVAGRTIRTPKTERHPKLLQLLHSLLQEEPERPFQRLFLFYDRAAEDSELPAVAEDWDVVARVLDDGVTEPPVIELQGISAGQLATVLTQYTPLETSTQHTADIGTNAAAIAALQGQVAALPAAPDLSPYIGSPGTYDELIRT